MTTDVADRGTVYLVGAGPGDPDLLTVRARRLIDRADVLLYDSLTPPEIVASAPGSTETIDVGKKPGPDGERTTQTEINRLMVDRACGGDTVVRLKGGDPNVFGRGGEETQHLADREIPFEVVPGVSSVLATGVTGIPLTHREHASSLTVVTGHEDPEKAESALDWSAIADTVSAGGTLVVLMGVRRLPDYAAALQARGVAPETPVAMVQKATWDEERTATGTLETIVDARDEAGIEPPAITVVGDVVSVREEVAAWLQRADASGLAFESEAVPIPGVANGAPGGD
jgi:uroporphyrin-III C-methyltransferase